jgi:hypothetical protein
MPWKECSVMDERLQFVACPLAGEAMSEFRHEFGISRKTGYRIFDRRVDLDTLCRHKASFSPHIAQTPVRQSRSSLVNDCVLVIEDVE